MTNSINNPKILQTYTVGIKTEGEGYDASLEWKGPDTQQTFDFILGVNTIGVKNSYSGFLEVYDRMLINWLKKFEILSADGSEVIPITNVIFGVPERTFAANQLEGKGSLIGRINLPAISVNRTDNVRSVNRGPTLAISHKQRVYFDDVTKKYVESLGVHKLIDLKYVINFWAKTQVELQMMIEQFLLPFQPDFYFLVKVPQIAFEEVIRCKFEDSITQTSLIASPDIERIVRASANITLEAYLPTLPSRIERAIGTMAFQKIEKDENDKTQTENLNNNEALATTMLYEHIQDTKDTNWVIDYNYSPYNHLVVFDDNGNYIPESDFTVSSSETSFSLIFSTPIKGVLRVMSPLF